MDEFFDNLTIADIYPLIVLSYQKYDPRDKIIFEISNESSEEIDFNSFIPIVKNDIELIVMKKRDDIVLCLKCLAKVQDLINLKSYDSIYFAGFQNIVFLRILNKLDVEQKCNVDVRVDVDAIVNGFKRLMAEKKSSCIIL